MKHKRKSPIKHKVRSHRRDGRFIHFYVRGIGYVPRLRHHYTVIGHGKLTASNPKPGRYVTVTELYRDYLKGQKPTFENFQEFYKEIVEKIMKDELVGEGTTSVTLRKRQAKEKGLLSLDNKIESYFKEMIKQRKIVSYPMWVFRFVKNPQSKRIQQIGKKYKEKYGRFLKANDCPYCIGTIHKEKALFGRPIVMVNGIRHVRETIGGISRTLCGIKIRWIKGQEYEKYEKNPISSPS